MNKLLSCVLSFALLSNCATPLAAQTPRKGGAPALKNIDLSNTNKPKMDPAIEANIKKAAQEAAA